MQVGDEVEIRAARHHPWRAGVISAIQRGCYAVVLSDPVTANEWSGIERRYYGNELVGSKKNPILVKKHVEQVVPGHHIRPKGGEA